MSSRLVGAAGVALAAAVGWFALAGLYLALFVPYHEWDALSYGQWSRLIAEKGHLWYPQLSDQTLHRPLFYVLQGWVWRLTGFHEATGRLLSLAFAVLLTAMVALLAAHGRSGRLRALLAVGVLLAVPAFAQQALAGLTDVPVAAAVAAAAAALWVGRTRPALVALASAGAVLAKPSALTALAGLVVAHALGPRPELRGRLRRGVLPLAAGAAVALAYDAAAARHLHEGLVAFLRAGSTGYYSTLAHEARRRAILAEGWLGSGMRLVVVFVLVYGVARLAFRHRQAALVAWPAALAWSFAGPRLAGVPGPSASARSALLTAAAAVVLLGTLACDDDAAPSRLETARLLAWLAPPLVVWMLAAGYDDRLLSPAWPALVLLLASVLTAAASGLARHGVPAAAPLLLVFVLALLNAPSLDGLEGSGWRQLTALHGRAFDAAATRAVVLPDEAPLIRLVGAVAGSGGRVFTSDGRLGFYFPGRVTQDYPWGCSTLAGYRAFVLLTDATSSDYLQRYRHVPATPAFWARCRRPQLTRRGDGPGYTVFAVR